MKTFIFILIIAALGGVFWMLRSDNTTADGQTLADPNQMRIVSMAPNLTEILYGLGLDKAIVAVSSDSNYPVQAEALPTVGTFWQPDLEAIIKACPTLVAAMGFDQQKTLSNRLSRLGCKTLSLNIESFAELYSGIETLGQATGKTTQARMMIDRIQGIQKSLIARFEGRPRPKVLWVIQREPLRVAGVDTFINDMITVCGGVNAIPKTLHQYPPISQESLLSFSPDVIIEPSDTLADFERLTRTASEFYGRHPTLPAVQNNRIYVLNGDLVSRLGPRIEEGFKQLAKSIWPEETIE
jgi:iron complex transport system substrate-binding protein